MLGMNAIKVRDVFWGNISVTVPVTVSPSLFLVNTYYVFQALLSAISAESFDGRLLEINKARWFGRCSLHYVCFLRKRIRAKKTFHVIF